MLPFRSVRDTSYLPAGKDVSRWETGWLHFMEPLTQYQESLINKYYKDLILYTTQHFYYKKALHIHVLCVAFLPTHGFLRYAGVGEFMRGCRKGIVVPL